MKESKTRVIKGIEIRHCKQEDFLQGWVRIPEEVRGGIPSPSFVKIKVCGKTIFCQVRGQANCENCVEMSEHYRMLLGLEVGQKVDVTITRVDWIGGKLKAIAMHPNHMVRFGFGFSCAGLILGLFGFIPAVLKAALSTIQSTWAWASWTTLGTTVLVVFLLGWLVGLVTTRFISRY